MSARANPASTDTPSMPAASARRAASTASRMAPSAVALRNVWVINGRRRHAITGRGPPLSQPNRMRPACSPVSYMSTWG
ncbi:hypothetical protein G6F55_014657 [Rhizopus delemar]|nr:hypothetical protein G6F55_014657 [Rhizopus delemar]